MSLKIVAGCTVALAVAGCEALEGECMTVEQEGPGLTGAASYVIGDGSRMDVDLGEAAVARAGTTNIGIYGSFVDAWNRRRSFELRVRDVAIGVVDLTDRGEVCLPRQSGGPDVCSPLSGTIEVRAHEHDCWHHSSGISVCADTMDFTIAARSEWMGTVLTIDAEMYTQGSWVDAECEH